MEPIKLNFPTPVDDHLPGVSVPGLSVGFVLLPGFTLMAFSGFVEVLRHAADKGDKSDQVLCRWKLMAADRSMLKASCGLEVRPEAALEDPAQFDYIVVVGGRVPRPLEYDRRVLDYLSAAQAAGAVLVGACTGSFALAKAGLMDAVHTSVHWFHYSEFQDYFPASIPVTDEIFIVDKGIITCAGGTSTMDLALYLVSRHCGVDRATKSLRHLISDQMRGANHPQIPLLHSDSKVFALDGKVRRAVFLMHQYIRAPLSIAEVAEKASIGERQLSRLFTKYLGVTPSEYYRQVRLEQGCWLLESTAYPVTQVAYETGFTDLSHFNRQFSQAYRMLPSQWRDQARAPSERAVNPPAA